MKRNIVIIISLFVLFILSYSLFNTLFFKNQVKENIDPVGYLEDVKDVERRKQLERLEIGIREYKKDEGIYPQSLEEVIGIYVPSYIDYSDPETGDEYEYGVLEEGQDFSLCGELDGQKVCASDSEEFKF